MTKNERSYIKNFGRVANSTHKPQYTIINKKDDVVSVIDTKWNEIDTCWIFTGVIFHHTGSYRMDFDTFESAFDWVEKKQLEIYRHDSFGDYMIFLLDYMSISKTLMAFHLDVSRQTIHDWINNEYEPGTRKFLELAQFVSSWTNCDKNTTIVDMCESIMTTK